MFDAASVTLAEYTTVLLAACAEAVIVAVAVVTPVVEPTFDPPQATASYKIIVSLAEKFPPPSSVISNVGVESLPGLEAGELNAIPDAAGAVLS